MGPSMSEKRSLFAFWSLELYNPQTSEFQAPGSGRAASSGLRSTLVPGSWRIYGPLSPIQGAGGASRYTAWFQLQLGRRDSRRGRSAPGAESSLQSIWRALEFSLGLGGEMKLGFDPLRRADLVERDSNQRLTLFHGKELQSPEK